MGKLNYTTAKINEFFASFINKVLNTTALSNDNDHIPTSGVVKSALNDATKSFPVTITKANNWSIAGMSAKRTASVVAISMDIVYTGTTTDAWVTIGTIESGYAPATRETLFIYDATTKGMTSMVVEPNGDIKLAPIYNGHEYWGNAFYVK